MKTFEQILWGALLLWSGVGLLVLSFGIDVEVIRNTVEEGQLRSLLLFIEKIADAAWMALAALLLWVRTARGSGFVRAASAFAWVALLSASIEAVGALTGFPFGPYAYTDRFGPMLFGLVPCAIPLAWWVVIEGSRSLAASMGAKGGLAALLTIAFALLTDYNLEPVAWKIRGYWEWYPGMENPPSDPPLSNYLAWGGLSALLAGICASIGVKRQPDWPSGLVLILVNLFFLAARFGHSS